MLSFRINQLNETITSLWNSSDEKEIVEQLSKFLSQHLQNNSWTLLFGRAEKNVVYFYQKDSASEEILCIRQSGTDCSELVEGISTLTYTDFVHRFPELGRLKDSVTFENVWSCRKKTWLVLLLCNLNTTHHVLHPFEINFLLSQSIAAIDSIMHNKELNNYHRYLEYISQLKPVTDHQEEPHVVISRILTIVENMFNAEAGIMLFDPRDETLVLQSPAFRADETEIKLYRLHSSEEGNASRVFVTGQPYFSNQAVGDPNIIQRFVQMYRVQNIATIPIEGKSGRIGVLHVINRKDRDWIEEDLKILHWISSQIGYILENARLLHKIAEQHNEAVKTAEILEKQRDIIEKQAKQLETKGMELEESLSLHRLFADILISGQGLDGIIRTLARKLHRSTLLLDKYLRILAMEIIEEDREKGISEYKPGDYFKFTLHVKRVPIQHMGQEFGTIILYPTSRKSSDQWANVILEQAKLALCLELMNRKSMRESAKKMEADLVQTILKDSIDDLENVFREALKLGHNLQSEHVVLVVRSKTKIESLQEEGEALDHLYDLIRYILDNVHAHSLSMKQPDHIVVLLSKKSFRAPDIVSITQLVRHLIKEVCKNQSDLVLHIGISRPCNRIDRYRIAYNEALKALAIAESLHEPIVDIDDFRSMEVLLESAEETSKAYVSDMIGPLIDHDRNKGGALLTTLLAYIECNGNLRTTAKRCFTHINTIRYRLSKIQEMLQCDLRNNRTLFDLHLALQLYRIMYKKKWD